MVHLYVRYAQKGIGNVLGLLEERTSFIYIMLKITLLPKYLGNLRLKKEAHLSLHSELPGDRG